MREKFPFQEHKKCMKRKKYRVDFRNIFFWNCKTKYTEKFVEHTRFKLYRSMTRVYKCARVKTHLYSIAPKTKTNNSIIMIERNKMYSFTTEWKTKRQPKTCYCRCCCHCRKRNVKNVFNLNVNKRRKKEENENDSKNCLFAHITCYSGIDLHN